MSYGQGYGYGSTNSRSDNALAIYLNPFSTQTNIPKIPDGKATFSTGLREQKNYEFPTTNGVFALLPSYKVAFTFGKDATAMPTRPVTYYQDFANQLTTDTLPTQSINDGSANKFEGYNNLERIRLVSAGVKFMCTGNQLNNAGYFKAIRFTSSNYKEEELTPANLLNEPSYVTGKIRDLSKYKFQLKPLNTSHDFRNAVDISILPDEIFDDNYDCLVIYFYGDDQTKVMAHTCHNFECIFDSDEMLARFHTSSIKDKVGLDKAQSALMSSTKAATRMSY